jgi:hypothetical protein
MREGVVRFPSSREIDIVVEQTTVKRIDEAIAAMSHLLSTQSPETLDRIVSVAPALKHDDMVFISKTGGNVRTTYRRLAGLDEPDESPAFAPPCRPSGDFGRVTTPVPLPVEFAGVDLEVTSIIQAGPAIVPKDLSFPSTSTPAYQEPDMAPQNPINAVVDKTAHHNALTAEHTAELFARGAQLGIGLAASKLIEEEVKKILVGLGMSESALALPLLTALVRTGVPFGLRAMTPKIPYVQDQKAVIHVLDVTCIASVAMGSQELMATLYKLFEPLYQKLHELAKTIPATAQEV